MCGQFLVLNSSEGILIIGWDLRKRWMREHKPNFPCILMGSLEAPSSRNSKNEWKSHITFSNAKHSALGIGSPKVNRKPGLSKFGILLLIHKSTVNIAVVGSSESCNFNNIFHYHSKAKEAHQIA